MSEMVLRMPSSYVDVEREEMEYIDGGFTAWQKALVATAVVAAGAGLVVACSYGQIWVIASIMKVTFAAAVNSLGITGVATIVGATFGVSTGLIVLALNKVF